MKKSPPKPRKPRKGKPFEVVKIGNISVPIYRQTNIVPKRDSAGRILYGPPDKTGKRRALVKYQSDIFLLAYYEGSKRIRQKFADLEKASREAETAALSGQLSARVFPPDAGREPAAQ